MAKRKEKPVVIDPQYIIMSSTKYLELQDLVNFQIEKGYQPVGGIFAMLYRAPESGFMDTYFYQAMLKNNGVAL